MTRAARGLFAALLIFFGAQAGCARSPTAASCPAGAVCLRYGNSVEPTTFDPAEVAATSEYTIVGDLMMGLVSVAPDGSPLPGIATNWTTSGDGLVWTFHLRPALWSDGAPVTASDFLFAFQRVLDPRTAATAPFNLYILKNAERVNKGEAPPQSLGVKAVDPHTLELTLEHPAPELIQLLKQPSFLPVPQHVVARYGASWDRASNYVSDGPFRLVAWKLGDLVAVEKNPRFWDAANVCVDRVYYLSEPDPVTAEREARRGDLDISTLFASNRLGLLTSDAVMRPFVRVHPQLANAYLAFNISTQKALADPRVRLALSEAIDRDFITRHLLGAGQLPAYSLVPPGVANYQQNQPPAWSRLPLASRQAQARALLSAAGFTPAHPLSLELKSATTPDPVLISQAIAGDWKAIGVQTTTQSEERQSLGVSLRTGDFEVALAGWSADFDDASTFLSLLRSNSGPQNYGHYRNPAFDALMDRADQETTLASRADMLEAAERVALRDSPVAPIYVPVSRNLVSPRVGGWRDNIEDVHAARWLCRK